MIGYCRIEFHLIESAKIVVFHCCVLVCIMCANGQNHGKQTTANEWMTQHEFVRIEVNIHTYTQMKKENKWKNNANCMKNSMNIWRFLLRLRFFVHFDFNIYQTTYKLTCTCTVRIKKGIDWYAIHEICKSFPPTEQINTDKSCRQLKNARSANHFVTL